MAMKNKNTGQARWRKFTKVSLAIGYLCISKYSEFPPKEIDFFGVGACCHRLVGPIICASSSCPANWWNMVSTPLPVLQGCMLQQSCGHFRQDSRMSEDLQTVGYNGDSKKLMHKINSKVFPMITPWWSFKCCCLARHSTNTFPSELSKPQNVSLPTPPWLCCYGRGRTSSNVVQPHNKIYSDLPKDRCTMLHKTTWFHHMWCIMVCHTARLKIQHCQWFLDFSLRVEVEARLVSCKALSSFNNRATA